LGLKVIKVRGFLIEFDNDWKGTETVYVNGQVVSKIHSFKGATHSFTVSERNTDVSYVLTSKINDWGVCTINLKCNGRIVKDKMYVLWGNKKVEKNVKKIEGLKLLNEYDVDDAIPAFQEALNFDNADPEIYFHLACCYSLEEKAKEGFEHLKLAVKHKLINYKLISEHDMLSYLRIQEGFEDFKNSRFQKYDKSKLT